MKNLVNQITTPNLFMRMLDTPDAKDVQELLAKNKKYMVPWVPWAHEEPKTVEEKKQQIRTWKGEFYLDQKYTYGVYGLKSNELIGLIFLLTRQGNDILEIGYIIDVDQAGKGYATESSYAMSKLGFEVMKIDKIVIICNKKNVASAKIPEKLGYKLECLRTNPERDESNERNQDMIWAMLVEEFEQISKYEATQFEFESGW